MTPLRAAAEEAFEATYPDLDQVLGSDFAKSARNIYCEGWRAALAAAPSQAASGDFQVRLRGIVVAPTENASPVLPSFPGASVEVDPAILTRRNATRSCSSPSRC